MLVSLKFVERFVALPKKIFEVALFGKIQNRFAYDVELLAPLLTRQGFEVESVTFRGEGFDSVVVGRIESAIPHPKADRLQICQVNVGEASLRQIVCGAKNARPELFVAVALPGSKLPGDLEIKESSIRDVESKGMLCSRAELGLPVNVDIDGDGIWELDVEAQGGLAKEKLSQKLGLPVFDALELRDTLLELNVTPNRPDMLCHAGVALEISAGLNFAGKIGERVPESVAENSGIALETLVEQAATQVSVAGAGGNFQAWNELGVSAFFVVLENVKVEKSPAWLRNLLEGLGQNSVNEVVDISNYVLLAHGQPSHAFDLEKLAKDNAGNRVLNLRFARSGEKLTSLDAKTRELTEHDCVVADNEAPQALLGVIGGEPSKVDFGTRSIVLEFANAHPVAVRRASRRHGRKTDSSFAFEKGIDTKARFAAAHEILGHLFKRENDKPLYRGTVGSQLKTGSSGARSEASRAFVSDEALAQNLGPLLKKGLCVDLSVGIADLKVPALQTAEWKSFFEDKRRKWRIPLQKGDQEKIVGGTLVGFDAQLAILNSLGFASASRAGAAESVEVTVPHWRWLDVVGMPDLIEEIVRVVGIDQVPSTPLPGTVGGAKDDDHLALFERASARAAMLGYNEIAGFHFMRELDMEKLGLAHLNALGEPVALLNPILKDEPLMQTSLVPNLLRRVARNESFGVKRGQLFHLSRTFQNLDANGSRVFNDNGEGIGLSEKLGQKSGQGLGSLYEYAPQGALAYSREKTQGGRPTETPRLAGVAFGVREEKTWQNEAERTWDLQDVLAHGIEILRSVGVAAQVRELAYDHPIAPALHPGRRAAFVAPCEGKKEGEVLGWAGMLHPEAARNFNIESPCLVFELNLAQARLVALQGSELKRRVVSPLRFPPVSRDFAFLFREEVTAAQLENTVRCSLVPNVLSSKVVPGKLLNVQVFDLYRGKGVPAEHKSVAFRIAVEPLERTLTEYDIQKIASAVVAAVTAELFGELRG